MKTLASTLTALILAGWIGTAAIISVQNFQPVSFKILTLQSIEIPFGVVLAFSAGFGAIAAAIVPIVFGPLNHTADDE